MANECKLLHWFYIFYYDFIASLFRLLRKFICTFTFSTNMFACVVFVTVAIVFGGHDEPLFGPVSHTMMVYGPDPANRRHVTLKPRSLHESCSASNTSGI